MVLCQLTYTTNRQINISTCPHRVVILNIAPKVFRTAKLSESNASAPTNKPPKNGLGNWNVIWKRGVTTMQALTIALTKQVVLTEKTSSNIKKRTQTTECHLSSHWTTIQKHPELCKIFKEPPVLAFRKPKSLKDILVRADISPRSAYNGQCQKCDSRRCMTCKNIQCTHKFSSTHTGEKFIIYCNANCKTENIIYLLECAICGLQYIGETKQQLSKRLNGHRSDANCKPDLPLSRHLRSTGHHDSFGKLKVTIIDHNPKWDDKSRQERESFWIRKLKDLITEWNQWEKVISSLDSYSCWSPPVVFSYIQFALLAQSIYSTLWRAVFLNEFGYYTIFNNILTVLFDTFTNNVSFLYLILFLFLI